MFIFQTGYFGVLQAGHTYETGRPGDEPFLLWGPPFVPGDGPKMVHFGPKTARPGRLVNVPKWSKRVQMGTKWSSQVFLTIWGHFGPIWTPLDNLKQKLIFCSRVPPPYFVHLGQKNHLCLKCSKGVQMDPKWSQMIKNTWDDHFGLFWTT